MDHRIEKGISTVLGFGAGAGVAYASAKAVLPAAVQNFAGRVVLPHALGVAGAAAVLYTGAEWLMSHFKLIANDFARHVVSGFGAVALTVGGAYALNAAGVVALSVTGVAAYAGVAVLVAMAVRGIFALVNSEAKPDPDPTKELEAKIKLDKKLDKEVIALADAAVAATDAIAEGKLIQGKYADKKARDAAETDLKKEVTKAEDEVKNAQKLVDAEKDAAKKKGLQPKVDAAQADLVKAQEAAKLPGKWDAAGAEDAKKKDEYIKGLEQKEKAAKEAHEAAVKAQTKLKNELKAKGTEVAAVMAQMATAKREAAQAAVDAFAKAPV